METTTATSAPTESVTTATPAPASGAQTLTQPLIAPEDRERLLSRARANVGLPAKDRSSEKNTATAEAPAIVPVATAPAEKPPETAPDDAADRLARIVREDRRLKADRAKLDEDRKAADADFSRLKAAKELREKGDSIGAIRALMPDLDVEGDLFWKLVESLKEPAPLTQKSVEETVKAELAAREEKARAEAKAQADAHMATAKDAYITACNSLVDKFPLVKSIGVQSEDVIAYITAEAKRTGDVPDPEAALKHFEDHLTSVTEAHFKTRNPAPAAPVAAPSITPTAAWASGAGGKASPPDKPMSLDEKREHIKKMLRAAS